MKNNIDKLFFASLAAAFWSVQASAQFLPRGITEVTDNLYWAHQDSHRTVFLVTDEGVILAVKKKLRGAGTIEMRIKVRWSDLAREEEDDLARAGG